MNQSQSNARVTVAIPFHQSTPHLHDAISSVLAQDVEEWLLILVSDGAPRYTVSELRDRYLDHRITVYADDDNRGLAARLNQSVGLTVTEYYARLDSDDVMRPDRLRSQIAYLDAHHDAAVVGTQAYYIDGDNDVIGRSAVRAGSLPATTLLTGSQMMHPTVTGRTEWFAAHPYDVSLRRTEDLDLWTRADPGELHNIDEPLTFYRVTGSQGRYRISQTCKEERRLAKSRLDSRTAMLFTVTSYAKEAVKLALEASGNAVRLERRRYRRIEPEESIEAAMLLESATRFAVY